MKRKEIKALHQKNILDLQKDLLVKRTELQAVRLEKYSKQLKNTRRLKNIKDDVARIETVIKEKHLLEKQK